MSDLGTIGLYVGTTAGINAANKITKGADPVPGLIASGFLFGFLGVVGALWRYDVPKAIAGLMLLAAVLIGGAQFFATVAKLASSGATGARVVMKSPPDSQTRKVAPVVA